MSLATLPTTAHIGSVRVHPNLVLAPMEGVTDLTFRRLIRSIGGCGLTVTEFIPAATLSAGAPKQLAMARFDDDEHPVAVQLYGKDPTLLARAARKVQDLGADLVDLNMGCPSKRVCQHSGGSALLSDPNQAIAIVRAMRAAVHIPLTVKMRSGWDPQHKNAPEIAMACQEEGVDAVTVHWRTRTDGYGGERELDTTARVVQQLSIPVFANGDVVDLASAEHTLAYTRAAGLFIGRGAIRNPWLFAQIADAQAGRPERTVNILEKKRVLLAYFASIRRVFQSDTGALGRFKKIARYFTEGLSNGAGLRTAIFHAQTPEQAIGVVERYLLPPAPAVKEMVAPHVKMR